MTNVLGNMSFGNTSDNSTNFGNEFKEGQLLTNSFNNLDYNKSFLDVFGELGNSFVQIGMVLFQVIKMVLIPLTTLIQVILGFIPNFIMLFFNSITYIFMMIMFFFKSIANYLIFIPQIIINIIKVFNLFIEYSLRMIGIIFGILGWFFGFAENGNEDELF